MSVASSRGVGMGVFALALVLGSCSQPGEKAAGPKPLKSHPPERVVLLRAEKQSNGRWKAKAVPDLLTIPGYDRDKPDAVVIWAYRHHATTITFAEPTIQAQVKPCDDQNGECILVLPKGLEYGKQYKYKISGKYSPTEDLEDNDPFIEVDR